MFVVFYSGHGALIAGTNHVYIPDGENSFLFYPLEVSIRNFRNTNPYNSFILGVFDCCRNVPELPKGHPLVEVDLVKSIQTTESGDDYIKGVTNICMVYVSTPTRTTRVSDRVTYALFEYLEKKEKEG